MHRMLLAAALVALLSHLNATPASAGLAEAGELEAARANARAGGPLSARDAELLERWGCLSGTDNDFCRHLRKEPLQHRRRRDPSRDPK